MTSQPIPPVIPTAINPDPADDDKTEKFSEKVSDEPYADPDTDVVDRTPVGHADRDADIRRSGGDPDQA